MIAGFRALLLLPPLLGPVAAMAAPLYDFTLIASRPAGTLATGWEPTPTGLNALGQVPYAETLCRVESGIQLCDYAFKVSDGAVTETVFFRPDRSAANATDIFLPVSLGIAANGVPAFTGLTQTGPLSVEFGVFNVSNDSLQVLPTTVEDAGIWPLSAADPNAAGEVAFVRRAVGLEAIVVTDGAVVSAFPWAPAGLACQTDVIATPAAVSESSQAAAVTTCSDTGDGGAFVGFAVRDPAAVNGGRHVTLATDPAGYDQWLPLRLAPPAINRRGRISAVLDTGGPGSFVGIWTGAGGSVPQPVAAAGVAGLTGVSYRGTSINDFDRVAFLGGTGAVEPDTYFVADAAGDPPTPVLEPGRTFTVAGIGPVTYQNSGGYANAGIRHPDAMNNRGQILLTARVEPTGGGPLLDLLLRAEPRPGTGPENPIEPAAGDELPGGGWSLAVGQSCGLLWATGDPARRCYVVVPAAAAYDFALVDGEGAHVVSLLIPVVPEAEQEGLEIVLNGAPTALIAGQIFVLPGQEPSGDTAFRISGIDPDGNGLILGLLPSGSVPANASLVVTPVSAGPPDADGDGIPDDVDNCPLTFNPDQADTDGDGVGDACDNCRLVANANQRNTDGDAYGNICDADFNNDGVVNFVDLAIFRSRFGTTNADADMNGDGVVNFVDLAIFRSRFGRPPGPGALVP